MAYPPQYIPLPVRRYPRIPVPADRERHDAGLALPLQNRSSCAGKRLSPHSPEGLLTIADNTFYLFEEDYRLPLLDPELAAYAATYAEHLLPLLLVLGLGTRLAALGLFVMTLTIQPFVYPYAFLSTHLGWFALALGVMAYGPGRLSIDHLLARKA